MRAGTVSAGASTGGASGICDRLANVMARGIEIPAAGPMIAA
ncbi:Uncharacterised protein [Mycobacteroides abscessus subsp. abscessus]|nr:Uncharacterised protein [Mycobacteroides abscessus subsp. abscessus]